MLFSVDKFLLVLVVQLASEKISQDLTLLCYALMLIIHSERIRLRYLFVAH